MQRPCPWHSTKGRERKSRRHEPGEFNCWPEPSAPASVCYEKVPVYVFEYLLEWELVKDLEKIVNKAKQ